MLAITFGCERLHEYIYGKKSVTVNTDHKPLEFILQKPLYQAPLRLQRMILKIQKYCVAVKYKPGKELLVGDTLSRACQQSHTNIAADDLSSIVNVDIIGILPISKEKVQQLQLETQADKKAARAEPMLQRRVANG